MDTIVIAIVGGVAVLLAGNIPWAGFLGIPGLGALNLAAGTAVPWALLPMTLYLWAYWKVIDGSWGDPDSRAARRANLRANRLSLNLWLRSLAAGLAGFAALLAFLSLTARIVDLPAGAPLVTPPNMPVATIVLLLTMQSIVAGVTEEAAFRGYMQSIVERSFGVGVAIAVNGVLFGLLHFGNHPSDVLLMLPYYVAVSAVYGGLTWAADSILPAIVLHSVGDVVVLTRWWATGRPEWQLTAAPPPRVSAHGLDVSFVVTAFAAAGLAAVTLWAYRRVHAVRIATRQGVV